MAPASAAGLRLETQALIDRMTSPPSSARSTLIDQMIGALITAGIWSKLDVLAVAAAHDSQAALLNWKGNAATATPIGSPVFVADRGFATDGSHDAIDWGWRPADGVSYALNSAMIGAWFRKGDRNAAAPIGTQTGIGCALNPRSSGDACAGRINGTVIATGGAVSTGFGFSAIDRAAANAVQLYAGGQPVGPVSTAASGSVPTTPLASGKANNVFADGQFCAHAAGGSLTAGQHAALFAALKAYMDAVGVGAIVPTTRTVAMTSATALPDGGYPVAPGKGMPCTGLAFDPVDGCWWVGNGLAAAQMSTGIARLSPDAVTVLGEYSVAGWGLDSSYAGSIQGIAIDTSDMTLWAVLKATSNGSWLLHISRTGALIAAPAQLPAAAANGIAYDPLRDQLAILYDASPASIRWFAKTGLDVSSSNQVIGVPSNFGDHLTIDPSTGDLLASWGDNGQAGLIGRFSRTDYGIFTLRETLTLAGSDAIEGLALNGSALTILNDGATHPGTPALNRMLRYTLV